MLKKRNKLLMTLLFVATFDAGAVDCKQYETRHINNKKTVTQKETLCILEKKHGLVANTKNCLLLKAPTCPFSKIVKGPEYRSFIGEIGAPGFNLCHYLKGSPQLYEIKIDDKWKRFERCIWSDPSDFVEINELITLYRSL